MKFSQIMIESELNTIAQNLQLDFNVNKLVYDSKKSEENDVFFAIKGENFDGNDFILDAVSRGAKAVFTDTEKISKQVDGINYIHVEDCRKTMAILSSVYNDFPSRKMKMIAVTGTNGKTTVANIIYHIFRANGNNAGMIGTNGNFINGKIYEAKFTTPESVELNEIFKKMAEQKTEYCVMEVSSHSLALRRVYGLDFDIAVYTNLSNDHLDFHGTMENYFTAKKMLFDSLEKINSKQNYTYAIYNCDDPYGNAIVDSTEAERISYGFNDSLFTPVDLKMKLNGMSFRIQISQNGEAKEQIKIKTKLIGKFNVYNILAAVAACKKMKMDNEQITKAIDSFEQVDGRFNIYELKNGAIAVIDYSHTPDSLVNALTTIKEITESSSDGKIITVFGCGGNRDKTKRPMMGKIATEKSSRVIITSDNPRNEEPMTIINEIKEGAVKENYVIEQDREKAIVDAISMSDKGDVVLIAGKGHETYQEIMGVRKHFSDKEIVQRFV